MGDQAARLRQLVDKSEYEVQTAAVPDTPSLSSLGPRVIAVTSGKGGVGRFRIRVFGQDIVDTCSSIKVPQDIHHLHLAFSQSLLFHTSWF